jgi:hypothetical protein
VCGLQRTEEDFTNCLLTATVFRRQWRGYGNDQLRTALTIKLVRPRREHELVPEIVSITYVRAVIIIFLKANNWVLVEGPKQP